MCVCGVGVGVGVGVCVQGSDKLQILPGQLQSLKVNNRDLIFPKLRNCLSLSLLYHNFIYSGIIFLVHGV